MTRPKNKIVTTVYSCDVCGIPLCENNEGLPSFRVSTYCSTEIYEHFCTKHTEMMDGFVKVMKDNESKE